eukprot:scaffold86735_cov54-Phaeocystis_antarctica.AAC.2
MQAPPVARRSARVASLRPPPRAMAPPAQVVPSAREQPQRSSKASLHPSRRRSSRSPSLPTTPQRGPPPPPRAAGSTCHVQGRTCPAPHTQ